MCIYDDTFLEVQSYVSIDATCLYYLETKSSAVLQRTWSLVISDKPSFKYKFICF